MASHSEMNELSAELVAIEQRLHKAGLHDTARRVNTAVQRIGWEFAEHEARKNKGAPEVTK